MGAIIRHSSPAAYWLSKNLYTISLVTRRIRVPDRIIEHVAIAIERLGIGRPPRTLGLLLIVLAELEPEAFRGAEGVFAIQCRDKPRHMEIDRQRRELRGRIHAERRRAAARAGGRSRHDAVRRDEPPQGQDVQPRRKVRL